MANRYWVGGTGNWDATTTNWSTTSGGAGGASVPTLDDDVFFNSASNATAYIVTLLTAPVCRSVTIAGPAAGNITIAGSETWSIYGSMTLAATGVTWTNTSTINFRATTTGWTVTTNGVSLNNGIIFNGAGGGWTLGSALTNTSTSGVTLTQGSFVTANFNLTITGGFSSTGALTRSLTLGSSAISCEAWNALGATNLTLNAGTSTITLTGTVGTFNGGGLTYYNVTKANNGFAIGDGGNTFNALTMSTINTFGTFVCSFAGNQTISTLTINGGPTQVFRASIQTPATMAGTQITLTVGSFITNGRVDFRDINLQGVSTPSDVVLRGGDCGNNTNITFPAPKIVYWNLPSANVGYSISTPSWALTSGGTPLLANFPLPQDTAIFENTGLNSGAGIFFPNSPNICNINTSTRTLPMQLRFAANAPVVYGNLTLSSAVSIISTTGSFTFSGFNKTQTFTSAGVTVEVDVFVNNLSTTVSLVGPLTIGTTKTLTLTKGTLDLNAQTVSTGLFSSAGTVARSINFNGGTMVVSGAAFTASGSNLTTSGSGTINMANTSPKLFAGGGFSYPTLNQGGAGALEITGTNIFANITNTVQPATITFPASTTTTVLDFNVNGTANNLITLNSSLPDTQATLVKSGGGSITVNYLSISQLNASPSSTWNARFSTDVENNTGWNFGTGTLAASGFFFFPM